MGEAKRRKMRGEYPQKIATCIECGCDDLHACEGGCTWERVDYEVGLGVCSECYHRVGDWDNGDRTLGEEAHLAIEMSDRLGEGWRIAP